MPADIELHLTTSSCRDILSNNKISPLIVTDLIRELYTGSIDSNSVRDALSDGQLASKIVACNMLRSTGLDIDTLLVTGGWVGTLSKLLLNTNTKLLITSLDIDPSVQQIATRYVDNPVQFNAATGDMYTFALYSDYGAVVNTSCEHIACVPTWLSNLHSGQTVLLQSNNLFDCDEHINCCSSIFDLIGQAQEHVDIISCNTLYCPVYERYTIIGQIK